MSVLLIETATTTCGVGLLHQGTFHTAVVDRSRNHTEFLADGIDAMLKANHLTPRDLTRIVVDRGPGLYTGLRVGIATAIGLAQGLGIDLIGVTSLEMIARGAFDNGTRGHLIGLVDGRRGEVFAQHFILQDSVKAFAEPIVATPQEVVERLRETGPVTLSGDGVTKYRANFEELPQATFIELEIPPLDAGLRLGVEGEPTGQIVPLYLRDPDAVANFSTRDQR